MGNLNMKREVNGKINDLIDRIIPALQNIGFGILTRIDFHLKIKEKLGKDIPPVVILGACNPALAYEAYLRDSNVTSLIPCNVVLRELSPNKVSIEIAKPSTMMGFLGSQELANLAGDADKTLQTLLDSL